VECFGLGESEVAHRIESALSGCPFEKGYPYTCPMWSSSCPFHNPKVMKPALGSTGSNRHWRNWSLLAMVPTRWRCSRNTSGIFRKIWLFDDVSEGYLLQRLTPHLKKENCTAKLNIIHGRPENCGEFLWRNSERVAIRPIVAEPHRAARSLAEISWRRGQQQTQRLPSKLLTSHRPYERENGSILLKARSFFEPHRNALLIRRHFLFLPFILICLMIQRITGRPESKKCRVLIMHCDAVPKKDRAFTNTAVLSLVRPV